MLKLFRDHLAKYFIIATLAAFIATIFFSWGMGTANKQVQSSTNVGVVGGQEINYHQFNDAYSRNLSQVTKDKEITEDEKRMILSNVWSQFVAEIIKDQFIANNNLKITGAELYEFLKNNPPQAFLQSKQLYKDGVFDTAMYISQFLGNKEALKQDEAQVINLEENYKNYLLQDKLARIISGGLTMSKLEKDEFISANSELGRFEFVKVPFDKFMIDDAKISDKDIKAFYDKNKNDYKSAESVNLAYIKIEKNPSKQDTIFIENDLADIRLRYSEGEEFGDLASDFSESLGADTSRGNLGFKTKNTVPFVLKSRIDTMKVGTITENIKSGNGYYIYKLDAKVGEGDTAEYKISEIYLPIRVTIDTEDSLRDILESAKDKFVVDGIKNDTTGLFSLSKKIPGIGVISNVSSFAYRGEIGEVSEVLETNDDVYMFKILEKKDTDLFSIDEIKPTIIAQLKIDSAKAKALAYANTLFPKIKEVGMDSVAKSDNFVFHYSTPQAQKKSDYIMGAGINNEFHAVAYTLKDNETTKKAIANNEGAFIVKRIFTNTIDSTQLSILDKQFEMGFNSIKSRFISLWFAAVEKNIEIEDYRYKFF